MQQDIARVNVDPRLCHYMASLGHNELIRIFLSAFSLRVE